MQPGKEHFYNIIDKVRRERDVYKNKTECYKMKCIELDNESKILKKEVASHKRHSVNLHNIITHQTSKHKQVLDELEIKNTMVEKQSEQLRQRDLEIERLKRELEIAKSLPQSNAKQVDIDEILIKKDTGHKSDGG